MQLVTCSVGFWYSGEFATHSTTAQQLKPKTYTLVGSANDLPTPAPVESSIHRVMSVGGGFV